MNQDDVSQASNPDIANSLIAVRRAARMARELAVRTDTDVLVWEDGRMVRITAEQLRRAGYR